MWARSRVGVDLFVELGEEAIFEGQIVTEGFDLAGSITVELGRQIDRMPLLERWAAANRMDVE